MKKFKQGGRFGERQRQGKAKSIGGLYGFKNEKEGQDRRHLFVAACTICGAECQVPFRPDGRRPIYCHDCFRRQAGEEGRGERPRKRYHGISRQPHDLTRNTGHGLPDQAALVRLLEKIDDKLDRILEAMGGGEEEEE